MESSILSEVDNTSDSQDGLSTRLLLSSQLATNLSALAPAKRAGAQRLCAVAHLRHAGMSAPCPLSGANRTRSALISADDRPPIRYPAGREIAHGLAVLMRRREFITLIGGIATWPVVARAQQPALAVIGVLNGQFTAQSANLIAAFRKGLAEAGYIEGRNLAIVYRSAEADVDRLPAL